MSLCQLSHRSLLGITHNLVYYVVYDVVYCMPYTISCVHDIAFDIQYAILLRVVYDIVYDIVRIPHQLQTIQSVSLAPSLALHMCLQIFAVLFRAQLTDFVTPNVC
jgi:hypothetical protein